ncbi:hypothetical protein [Microbacterium elymi]|uniref:Uncharacterized protein n=1 Tax=Microbacterium elymi TaxID=2909587 RepID=A0ABY5NNE5_9MICO|nr:hypothetical protein [Microbacterium elymi]UUT36741.1 hypothetical protein L2X98_31330 [Microbacterium elymi]
MSQPPASASIATRCAPGSPMLRQCLGVDLGSFAARAELWAALKALGD